ncbi:hypothetical protein TwortDSMZ_176 [Staphylococcus phage Twort]|uniref:Uncharacterized protein n=1 Tax=Staphylococcus phage Twort (strain DSM 17442 / HER 48) TaxID=2908167 RepID=A0A6H0X5G7_BPTWO|nr:hypothetical protein TwortDSMZ_176 [Staphylococcus phage Twort]
MDKVCYVIFRGDNMAYMSIGKFSKEIGVTLKHYVIGRVN